MPGPVRENDDRSDDVPMPAGVVVRRAREGETVAVLRVLEGALLDVEVATVRTVVADGGAVVAVRETDPATPDQPESADNPATPDDREDAAVVVGALVRTRSDRDRSTGNADVEAIAVRPSWRGRGVGTALVEAAAGDVDRLTATFRPSVRPFYASLGFETTGTADDDRVVGVLEDVPDG